MSCSVFFDAEGRLGRERDFFLFILFLSLLIFNWSPHIFANSLSLAQVQGEKGCVLAAPGGDGIQHKLPMLGVTPTSCPPLTPFCSLCQLTCVDGHCLNCQHMRSHSASLVVVWKHVAWHGSGALFVTAIKHLLLLEH